MTGLLLLCRPGFEGECARETERLARGPGAASAAGAAGEGYAVVPARDPESAAALAARCPVGELVFARQAWAALESLPLPPPRAAAARLAAAAERWAGRLGAGGFQGVFAEAADGERGRRLQPACARLVGPLETELASRGLLREAPGAPRLHVFLAGEGEAWLGVSDPRLSSPWPMGIPRLRFPRGAPSRSALKLEEAFVVFLSEDERRRRLRAGLRAADLGASPGGWSWALASRGLRVAAVDNGPLAPSVLEGGLVEHVRADGFTWRPPRPVHWLVCDMVTAPARVAKLVGVWGARRLFREAVFNLKLPSGRRLEEVGRCAAVVARELDRAGVAGRLRLKHLYHDRDEVTAHLRLDEPEALRRPARPAGAPPGRRTPRPRLRRGGRRRSAR